MAKHKAAGGKASQHVSPAGKRPGIKEGHGKKVMPGMVLVRQKGSNVSLGSGVKRGRDFTVYATKEGIVTFGHKLGKKIVSVLTS